jgi:hypothetical protein
LFGLGVGLFCCSSALELELLGVLEFVMASSIDTIYKYTEALIKEQESSLVRLDTKSTVLIAFAGTIAKVTIDLNSKAMISIDCFSQLISFKLSAVVYIFSALTVFLASLGITARARELAVDPKELMSDEWFDLDEDIHKGYIISSWITMMNEQCKLAKRKSFRLNLTVICLNIAMFSLIIIVLQLK